MQRTPSLRLSLFGSGSRVTMNHKRAPTALEPPTPSKSRRHAPAKSRHKHTDGGRWSSQGYQRWYDGGMLDTQMWHSFGHVMSCCPHGGPSPGTRRAPRHPLRCRSDGVCPSSRPVVGHLACGSHALPAGLSRRKLSG